MKLVLLTLLVVGCGSSKPAEKPFVTLDEPDPKGSTSPPVETTPPPKETPPVEPEPTKPTDKVTNDDLEKAEKQTGTQAAIAWKLNDDGIALMKKNKHGEASSKFREAVARVPEPRYFYNLCVSLFMEGKFSEGLVSCDAVEKNSPTDALRAKAEKMMTRIKWEAKQQKIELETK